MNITRQDLMNRAGELRRQSFHFADAVAPGATVTLKRRVPRHGTIERLYVRLYAGNELALRVVPYVMNERLQRRDLVDYAEGGGKTWIDGDDEQLPYNLREPVTENDTVYVQVENVLDPLVYTDTATYTYNFLVIVEIDYAGGVLPFQGGASGA